MMANSSKESTPIAVEVEPADHGTDGFLSPRCSSPTGIAHIDR
jgi:hypothetical protein